MVQLPSKQQPPQRYFLSQVDLGRVYIYSRHQRAYLPNTSLSSFDFAWVSILLDQRNSKIITVYDITMMKNAGISCDVVKLLILSIVCFVPYKKEDIGKETVAPVREVYFASSNLLTFKSL